MTPAMLASQVRRLRLSARRAVEEWLGGAYHSVFHGVGIAFEEVREYQPGDDVRAIDWNVTARAGTPFIKRFIEERELTVMLAVDIGPSMAFGSGDQTKLQSAIRNVAAIAVAALHGGDRVGMLLFADQVVKWIPPRKGIRHALTILRELLAPREPANRPSDVALAIAMLSRVLHRRALVVLASDFAESAHDHAVRLISRRHDTIAIVPGDPWERDLPDIGLLSVLDPATGAPAWVDTSDGNVRRDYHIRAIARIEQRRRTLGQAEIDFLETSTEQESLEDLRRFFDRRSRRKHRRR